MRIDDHIAAVNRTPVSWDDVREQRVLSQIQRERRGMVHIARRRHVLRWTAVAAAALTTLGIAVWVLFSVDKGPTSTQPEMATAPPRFDVPPAAAPIDPVPSERMTTATNGGVLGLGDAGRVVLFADAEVSVRNQSKTFVSIVHVGGKARYEITPNRHRRVEVTAAGVRIGVVGTVFTVTRENEVVTVEVSRGIVEVDDGDRALRLGKGEKIQLSTTASPSRKRAKTAAPSKRRRSGTRSASQETPDALFDAADKARAAGDFDKAAAKLTTLISRNVGANETASAYFTLGKVERRRGRLRQAAKAFDACADMTSPHALKEDAFAEAARAWSAAGDRIRAQKRTEAYLQRYPNGIHAKELADFRE